MHKGLQKCTHTNLAVSLAWHCLNGLCCFSQPPLLFPALNVGLSKTLFRTVIFILNVIHFSKLQLSCTAITFLCFKFTQPQDAAFQRSTPSFALSQAFSLTRTPNPVHVKMHYSSPSYAYAHSLAEVWADILSALQMAWPVDTVNI